MNRKILLLGLSIILLILPISTSTSVRAQPMYPPPMVAGITPSSGEQGQTLDLIISGHHFQDGAFVTFSPPTGISITSLTFMSPMELRVSITIAPDAPPGPRDVTVTNPDGEYVTLEDGFTVTAKDCSALKDALDEASQAAEKACQRYEGLKAQAEKEINDAEKAIADKEKALKDCEDEKEKLEKEMVELKNKIGDLQATIRQLESQAKILEDAMQKARYHLGSEVLDALGIGQLHLVGGATLLVLGIATGPITLIGLAIGGGLEIASALKTRGDFNYYLGKYKEIMSALNRANDQLRELVNQLSNKEDQLASKAKACDKQQTELDEAKAALEKLKDSWKAELDAAEKECNDARQKEAEAKKKYEDCLKALEAE